MLGLFTVHGKIHGVVFEEGVVSLFGGDDLNVRPFLYLPGLSGGGVTGRPATSDICGEEAELTVLTTNTLSTAAEI